MAGVGEEVHTHELHAAHFGLVAQNHEGQGFRMRPGEGLGHRPPVPGLGTDPGVVGRAGQPAEQGFVHGLQHGRIAQDRDQQTPLALDTEQVAGGGIGQHDPTPGDVVRLAARHDEDRVGQGLENTLQQGGPGLLG